jgi:predicted component of type VI protein secretion system
MDWQKVKEKIAHDYKNQCLKLSLPFNEVLCRNFSGTPKSLEAEEKDTDSIDIVFRGNDKWNFASRMKDKDLLILCQVMDTYKQHIRHIDLSYNEISNTGCTALGKFLQGNILSYG